MLISSNSVLPRRFVRARGACTIATASVTRCPQSAGTWFAESGEERVKTGGIRGGFGQVRFDGFVLDPVCRRLTCQGEVLHLTPKAFDLLAVLVDQAPRVIPKSELHERVWQETFVSDATLVGVVKELRRVLDDRSPDSPIIRTVHRVGYAFCRSIDESPANSPTTLVHWVVVDERKISLRAGENLIGRDPASTVWLDSTAVSRRHARILVDSHGVRLEDLGSKNGTRIGGDLLVGECALRDGDVITIGSTRLRYRVATGGATTETRSTRTFA
jgi:DNA-binding winged helix-turn-helix (wHTH) protein